MNFIQKNVLAEVTSVSLSGNASGLVKVPTLLSLSHSPRSKTFTVSWSAGSGNGGASGCKIQYYSASAVWTDISNVNCDASGASAGTMTLPSDGWYGSSWSSVSVRLVRVSDGVVIGNLGSLSCSSTAGSEVSTPNVDENCNNNWDDSVVGGWTNWINDNKGSCCWTTASGVQYHEKGSWKYTCAQSESFWPGRSTLNNSSVVEYRCLASEVQNYCYGQNGVAKSSCYGSSCNYECLVEKRVRAATYY